jgi:hypothetical protein
VTAWAPILYRPKCQHQALKQRLSAFFRGYGVKPADRLFNLLALASGAGGLFLVMLFYAERQAKVLVAFFADIVIGWHVRPPN